MTIQALDFSTKKAFMAAVKEDPNSVFLNDPSFFNPPISTGTVAQFGEVYAGKQFAIADGSPQRKWFATIAFDSTGKVKKVS